MRFLTKGFCTGCMSFSVRPRFDSVGSSEITHAGSTHLLFTIYHLPLQECLQSKGNMNGSRRPRYRLQLPGRWFAKPSLESHVRWSVPKRKNRCRSMLHHPPTLRAPSRCSCGWPRQGLHRQAVHTHFVLPARSRVFLPTGQDAAPRPQLRPSFSRSRRQSTTKRQPPKHCNLLL